jgi:hypothetical protein
MQKLDRRRVRSIGSVGGRKTFMHTAHAKRIAWFLKFQQILHFPKYPLAPLRTRLRGRIPSIDGFDFGAPRTLDKIVQSLSTGRPKRSPELYRHQSWISPKAIPSVHTGVKSRVAAVNIMGTSGIPGIHQAMLISTSTVRQEGLSRGFRRQKESLEPSTPDESPLPGSAGEPDIERAAAPGRKPYLARPSSYDASISLDPQPRETYRPTRPRGDPLLRVEPPAIKHTAEAEPVADETCQPAPDAPGYPSEGATESRKAAQTATIHIDGSVLGRWTTQHLERVLGRPATGMTGVDPRSSAPRSRISPF